MARHELSDADASKIVSGSGKLRDINIRPAKNGFTVDVCTEGSKPKGKNGLEYTPGKTESYVYDKDDIDELVKAIRGALQKHLGASD